MTYLISPQAVEIVKASISEKTSRQTKPDSANQPHNALYAGWVKAMRKGLISGKPLSESTIDYYSANVKVFLQRHELLSSHSMQTELMRCPTHQFGKRSKLYKALVCFAKFLIHQGALEPEFLESVKGLRPKRHLPPKRLTVDEQGLEKLLDACETPSDKLIVSLLSQTGLRASELCALRLEDIDTDKAVLTVRLGKGGKTRRVGLSAGLLDDFNSYLEANPKVVQVGYLFLSPEGKPMSRHGLHKRLERIGKAAKVPVTPHALRRAFVTVNANKGRPLQMIQQACGHSDIKTTMSYCLTTEQEVIDAMKQW